MADGLDSTKCEFADLIGNIGDAWGLPRDACRVHALIYLNGKDTPTYEIVRVLSLPEEETQKALSFLVDYELAWTKDGGSYQAHLDPWEAMLKGLDQRRGRDLPVMRSSLQEIQTKLSEAQAPETKQVEKMIKLVNDLSAIHAQAFRMSPRLLRGMVGLTGRAARLVGGRDK